MVQHAGDSIILCEAELEALAKLAHGRFQGKLNGLSGATYAQGESAAGHEYSGLRAYAPGDEVRTVNWRASARGNQFYVHQYRRESSSQWLMCLDCSASMGYPTDQKWKLAVQLSAAFGYLLLALGHEVSLVGYDNQIKFLCPLGRGKHQYQKIYQALSGIKPRVNGGDSLFRVCKAHMKPQISVFLISDFLVRDLMKQELEVLVKTRHRVHAVQTLDSKECQIQSNTARSLRDCESGDINSIQHPVEIQSYAAMRLENIRGSLNRHCRRNNIAFTDCTTAESWKDILIKHIETARH